MTADSNNNALLHEQLKKEARELLKDWIEVENKIAEHKSHISDLREMQRNVNEDLAKTSLEMRKQEVDGMWGIPEFMLVRGRDGSFYLFHFDVMDATHHELQPIVPMITREELRDV